MFRLLNRACSSSGRAHVSRPSISTLPLVGRVNPASMYSSVVLPQPDPPVITMNSPRFTSRLASRTAATGAILPAWYTLLSPRAWIKTSCCSRPMPRAGVLGCTFGHHLRHSLIARAGSWRLIRHAGKNAARTTHSRATANPPIP